MTTNDIGASVHPMQLLLESDYGLTMPLRGEIREGVIARITPNEILVDVGAKSEGVINGRELDSLDDATRKALVVGLPPLPPLSLTLHRNPPSPVKDDPPSFPTFCRRGNSSYRRCKDHVTGTAGAWAGSRPTRRRVVGFLTQAAP